jgi:uncharacterized protein involved in response to NO
MLIIKFLILYTCAFLLNLPFGYIRSFYRQKTLKHFAMKMFLIHAPIPLVIFMRKYVLGLKGDHIWQSVLIITISVMVCILGQVVGARVIPRILAQKKAPLDEISVTPMETASKENV